MDNFEAMDNATKRAGQREHKRLTHERGRYRTIPTVNPSDVLALAAQFENMVEPIRHLAGELELMAHLPPQDFNITPILLLGEPGKDEFFQISFNASHAMWILTANTVEGMADPLVSRMTVFDIPTPGIEQRKRIIKADFKNVLAGIELMHMIRKGQLMMRGCNEMSFADQFYALAGKIRPD